MEHKPKLPDSTALIERLEKADGPSRELDLSIRKHAEKIGVQLSRAMLRYTASIDAAGS